MNCQPMPASDATRRSSKPTGNCDRRKVCSLLLAASEAVRTRTSRLSIAAVVSCMLASLQLLTLRPSMRTMRSPGASPASAASPSARPTVAE